MILRSVCLKYVKYWISVVKWGCAVWTWGNEGKRRKVTNGNFQYPSRWTLPDKKFAVLERMI
jgi:hypothetical protein